MYLHCSTVSVCLQPLQIKSAVAVEGLKGYIYIEAYKQTHVKQVKIIKKEELCLIYDKFVVSVTN